MSLRIKDLSTYNQEYHQRLVDKLPTVCEKAGIPQDIVFASYKDISIGDMEFITNFGYEYTTAIYDDKQAYSRFQLITAMYLRNYIDATLVPVSSLPTKDIGYAKVLLIPDFCDDTLKNSYVRSDIRKKIMEHLSKTEAKLFVSSPISPKTIGLIYGDDFKNILLSNGTVFRKDASE